ncbi:MAG: Flagellar basal body-associated protein FliL [Thermodesulfobacterium commune]|uniref:Uncharacterized protein n=1 Tax=Thermodesulfobacterium commune TaxID=1741 RepID=A0A101FIC0_9BACT|nr:MAG: Flagellar basal body-associated protein FliL [Thermodesulfobacterium commune]HAA84222.1 hypothetical protein [Thermodesulfobacterium commune]
MEEELKKDLEEIKKDVEQTSSEEIKESSQYEKQEGVKVEQETKEEVLPPEKASTLVEDLIEKPEDSVSQEIPSEETPKASKISYLEKLKNPWIWGILGSTVLLLAGIFFIFKIFFFKEPKEPQQTSKVEPLSEITESSVEKKTPVNATETSKVSKIIISQIEQKDTYYPYKLEMKELLIPVGNKDYLNVDLVFYFDNSTTMKEIVNSEIVYREFIYEKLQKVPLSVWFDVNKKKELEENLKEEIKKKGLTPVPQKIEIEGVVFRG